jgi:DNA-binding transcriptional LysR family regulator
MNEKQLASFLAAADAGSFSKAAKQNYISTPALISQIEGLESSMNTKLFIRSARGITLSKSGTIFYDTAKKILQLYEQALASCAAQEDCTLKIALAAEQYPAFFMSACTKFKHLHPQYDFEFVNCSYNEQIDALKKEEAQAAIIAKPKKELLYSLEYQPLYEDHYAFGMNACHPLAAKDKILPADLHGQLVVCGHYPYMETSFAKTLAAYGANIEEAMQEYNAQKQKQTLFKNQLLVFHSRWAKNYSGLLVVKESDIPAGSIGLLYSKKAKEKLEPFIQFLEENEKETSK